MLAMALLFCHRLRWLQGISGSCGRQLTTSQTTAQGYWQVSSHGRICSRSGAISYGSAHPSGYSSTEIGGEKFYVHRVVAHAFLGPPPSQEAWQVHHKDGDSANNRVTNLEYVTCSQNVSHSYARGARRCGGPMRWKPVMYRALGSEDWTRCASVMATALELSVSRKAVSKACQNKAPLQGYEFIFADLNQLDWPGEDWRQMLCPVVADEVPGRLVSSFGRFRTSSGRIRTGYLRNSRS